MARGEQKIQSQGIYKKGYKIVCWGIVFEMG